MNINRAQKGQIDRWERKRQECFHRYFKRFISVANDKPFPIHPDEADYDGQTYTPHHITILKLKNRRYKKHEHDAERWRTKLRKLPPPLPDDEPF